VQKETINIVWFKRDLRLFDQPAITHAQKEGKKTLLFYCFEPRLAKIDVSILIVKEEALQAFQTLHQLFDIDQVFSLEETGIRVTYDRDKALSKFFKNQKINWLEFQNNGVRRGLKNRKDWALMWEEFMTRPFCQFDPSLDTFLKKDKVDELGTSFELFQADFKEDEKIFQQGGESEAWKVLQSFLKERARLYSRSISKPAASRTGCSRLSPHLAWGNLSIRQVYQKSDYVRASGRFRGPLQAFQSRLHYLSLSIKAMQN